MKKLMFATVVAVFLFSTAIAQSGRKVKRGSTFSDSLPTKKVIDKNLYSESRPFNTIKLIPKEKKEKPTRKKRIAKPNSSNNKKAGVTGENEIISIDTTLVTIPVSVFDSNGIYVPHISKEDFKIFEDGKEQEIAYFGKEGKPFTVALVLDTSGSTQFKIEDIHYAAKSFVRQLQPQDKVLVIQFSDKVRVRAEATNDRVILDKAIEKARYGGMTSLYDAVEFTLKKRLNKIEGRKAIVLFTDGVDTGSCGATAMENIKDAEEADALIYSVYYNTFLSGRSSGTILNSPFPGVLNSIPVFGGTVDDAKAHTYGKIFLESLASYTGGKLFHAGSSRFILVQAFKGIAEELRTQYNIGYFPTEVGEKGDRKQIKVRVYRPNLRIRTRDSYVVGEN